MNQDQSGGFEFWHVDAFSAVPYKGNPAAIVFDADDLTGVQMQTIARQMNLSETVFVMPPTDNRADYAVRIFTPKSEVSFAGHPTIASAFCHCRKKAGNNQIHKGSIIQQCEAGLIPIDITQNDGHPVFTMTQLPPQYRDAEVDRELAGQMLGLERSAIGETPVEVCSTGVDWMVVPVTSMKAHRKAKPDLALIEEVCRARSAVGITSFSPEAADPQCSIHLRTFAPGEGITEDPVCGSGNGSVAAYIARHLRADEGSFEYRAEQGAEVYRDGRIWVSVIAEDDECVIRVGGQAALVMKGELFI